MARTLNTHVLVGEKVYEPGTPESEIDGDITADVWDEAESKLTPKRGAK